MRLLKDVRTDRLDELVKKGKEAKGYILPAVRLGRQLKREPGSGFR